MAAANNSSEEELRILCFNVGNDSKLLKKEHKKLRVKLFKDLVDSLPNQPDLILLQEYHPDFKPGDDWIRYGDDVYEMDALVLWRKDEPSSIISFEKDITKFEDSANQSQGRLRRECATYETNINKRKNILLFTTKWGKIIVASFHGEYKGIKDKEKVSKTAELLRALNNITQNNEGATVILGGDFNVDVSKVEEKLNDNDNNNWRLKYPSPKRTKGRGQIDFFAFREENLSFDCTVSKLDFRESLLDGENLKSKDFYPTHNPLLLIIQNNDGQEKLRIFCFNVGNDSNLNKKKKHNDLRIKLFKDLVESFRPRDVILLQGFHRDYKPENGEWLHSSNFNNVPETEAIVLWSSHFCAKNTRSSSRDITNEVLHFREEELSRINIVLFNTRDFGNIIVASYHGIFKTAKDKELKNKVKAAKNILLVLEKMSEKYGAVVILGGSFDVDVGKLSRNTNWRFEYPIPERTKGKDQIDFFAFLQGQNESKVKFDEHRFKVWELDFLDSTLEGKFYESSDLYSTHSPLEAVFGITSEVKDMEKDEKKKEENEE